MNICRDCKHYSRERDHSEFLPLWSDGYQAAPYADFCLRRTSSVRKIHPVSGQPCDYTTGSKLLCEAERMSKNSTIRLFTRKRCGPEGKYFECKYD